MEGDKGGHERGCKPELKCTGKVYPLISQLCFACVQHGNNHGNDRQSCWGDARSVLWQLSRLDSFISQWAGMGPKPYESCHEKKQCQSIQLLIKTWTFHFWTVYKNAVFHQWLVFSAENWGLNSWPLYSQYGFFSFLLKYTMMCQKRNPNLFLDIPGWPNKFFLALFSFLIAQLSLHSVLFRVSVMFRWWCLSTVS